MNKTVAAKYVQNVSYGILTNHLAMLHGIDLYVQMPNILCRRGRVFIRGTKVGPIPGVFLDGEGGERHTRSLIDKELCFAVGGGGSW
jgi:hypothetical protein